MKRPAVVAGAVSALAIAAVSGAALAGCATASQNQHAPSSHASGPLYSPFTGERVTRLNRVLAVKIDNIVYARPQTGINHADIVFVEPVEGGLSRFLVVFSSHYPP